MHIIKLKCAIIFLRKNETFPYFLLTGYDNDTITYDEIGNPLNYRDGMTMSWSGRELQSITKNSNTYSFTYNLNGLRTKKNINGTKTFYYYDDSNNLIGLKKGNTTVLFYYDSEGSLYSMSKGDDTYFFIKDLQGDIRKIIDENGTVVATYAYDAWGALLAENEDSSVEGLNPFRYRGYVYDHETQLYYLQSRYYDPITGRFLNADDTAYIGSTKSVLSSNLFSYCENNCITKIDKYGNFPILIPIACIFIGCTLAASIAAEQLKLSAKMYVYAQKNDTYFKRLSYKKTKEKFGHLMIPELKKAKKIKSRINKCIEEIKKQKKTSHKYKKNIFFEPSNIADIDLALAVGHADNCTVKVKKTKHFKNGKRKYSVSINLEDLYDFSKANSDDSWWVAILKNNGYSAQTSGEITPYWWKIKFSFSVYRKD